MNYLSTEYLIVYAFLGITLLVGSWGTTARTFKEYAIADKRFGTGALAMTILATWISGGYLLKDPQFIYHDGLSGISSVVLGTVVSIYIVIYFFASKIVHFKNCMTAGDLMRNFYGEGAQIMTGILAFLLCSHICSRQIMYLKATLGYLDMDNTWGVPLAVGILALYTTRGGMGAVIATDILHFIVVFAVIPLIAHLMFNQAGGFSKILNALSAEQADLFSAEKFRPSLGTKTLTAAVISMFIPSAAVFGFPFIQRMLMAKHQQQSVGMYRNVLAVLVPFLIITSIIGLAGIVLYPATSEPILSLISKELSPVGKGLLWVSILGLIISTADSFLHTAGIAFAHDTVKPLATRLGFKKVNELKVAQYTTFVIAFVGFVVSLTPHVANNSWHNLIMRGITLPFIFPIILGVRGLKTDKMSFYVSTAITLAFYTLSLLLLQGDLATDVPDVGSSLVSLFSYLCIHYYYHSGFVMVNRSVYGQTTTVWHPSWQGTKTSLTSLIPTPQKVVRYFQQSIAENSSNTTTLALFVAVSYMVPLFMHSIGHPEAYEWLLVLRIVGAMFCVGLLLQSQWPASLLRFFPTFYHFALLWCFPFMTTFLFFLEGGSTEWVMNVMLSIMIFILLLDYMTAIGLAIAGIALAMVVYRLGIGPLDVSMDRDTAYMLAYGAGFSIAIGVLFSRLREKFAKQANRRLVHQQAAVEAHFPAVVAETEKRTQAFQQIGINSLLHTARKLHTIQYKTVAAQQEQQNLFASLTQRQKALMNSFMQREISQEAFFTEQQELQAEFDALTQQPSAPQSELPATDGDQAPQAELQTLAQHHLSPQAELNSLAQQQQDLQADLLPLAMQLQDLDTRGKDHLTLDINKDLSINQLLGSLQDKLLPRGIDVPLLIEKQTQQQKLTVDGEQLAILLVKGIAALQWLIKDQDQYLLLGIEDTQLSYPLPDVEEGYVKQIPALRLTITAAEKLPSLADSYRPDLTNFTPAAHQTFQEMDVQADTRLIKAHYGHIEMSENTLIYVIPLNLYDVRPLDMDKPELAIGTMPARADDHFKNETVDAQAQEEAFLKVVAERSNANLGMIKLALNLIKWYHGHKNRHSGEPFYLHPLAVAQIVMDYSQDEATIVGALLHDTVEDTPMLVAHIEALFGQETAEVVDLVTHLQSMPGSMYKVKLSAEENLRMLGNSVNTRGLYVKLADRMHNMRTINGHPKVSKRKLVARETMDFFVPLAKKLGLTEAAAELAQLGEDILKMTV